MTVKVPLPDIHDQIKALPDSVPVLISRELLDEMTHSRRGLPSRMRLHEIGEPDSDGFYTPTLTLLYEDEHQHCCCCADHCAFPGGRQ